MRIVVKVGSSIIEFENFFEYFSKDVSDVINKNEVCIVSSGAILLASKLLGRLPKNIRDKQIFAAIGQPVLMQKYSNVFKRHQLHIAQVLLTRSDFESRKSFLNLKKTIEGLMNENVIPIINENDSVAVDEIKFGDNDILSAYVATKLMADRLIILTDVDGLIKDGEVVKRVYDVSKYKVYGTKNFLRHGGFESKLMAARMCMESGIECIVAKGYDGVLKDIMQNKEVGTVFVPYKKLSLKKRWILFHSKAKGKIHVDEGAYNALKSGKSLLPKGVLDIQGVFEKREVVDICFESRVIGKGIVRYSSNDILKIMGKRTHEVKDMLKYGDEVIDAHELVII
ncbi:MAG: glutamate 5-kinase [bacterium]|nr:glutamate 5-kinase [bacterium]